MLYMKYLLQPFKRENANIKIAIVAAIILAVILRLLAGYDRETNDLQSWRIVGDIVLAGKNVYVFTTRYNYGPIWFIVLGALRGFSKLLPQSEFIFATSITIFLSFIDIGIALILYKKVGKMAFFLMLLNPISIAVSGFWRQFDNVAILAGLVAMLFLDKQNQSTKNKYLGLILLGISLVIKHDLIFLPFWIAFSAKSFKDKAENILIPLGIFLISFVPFLNNESCDKIISQVFLYSSTGLSPVIRIFYVDQIFSSTFIKIGLFGLLIMLGFFFKRRTNFEKILNYLILLLSFTPSVARQYLAIPVPALISKLNPGYFLFIVLSGIFLLFPFIIGNNWGITYAFLFIFLYAGVFIHYGLLNVLTHRKGISNGKK
jgi:hypothetical protein